MLYSLFFINFANSFLEYMKNTNKCAAWLLHLSFLFVLQFFVTACEDTLGDGDGDGGGEPLTLPQVHVTTNGNVGINSKTEWVGGNITIFDKRGNESLSMNSEFRGRGNSTWLMPKKAYAVKLNKKEQVLGMPSHKRWVLLANWLDRTLLRNDVAFEIARKCLPFTPRGEFVELYLNGEHRGNYYLCEQIRVDKNRVNIDEIDENTTGEDITGGYLLEFDTYAEEEINYFYTKCKNLPVTIKSPDEDVVTSWEHPAFVYIKDYVNSVEDALEQGSWDAVEKLIDVKSYADWFLVYNLTGNAEPGWPKSCYMYKKRGGKLYAGPAWDFDCATFMPGKKGLLLCKALWYPRLLEHEEFKQLLKRRWGELRCEFEKIPSYIDEQAGWIKESNEVNFEMWPVTQNTNNDITLSFDEAVARIKAAYEERMLEIDNALSAF